MKTILGWVSEKKHLILSAVLLSGICWVCAFMIAMAYLLWGQTLIEDMFFQRAGSFFNQLIDPNYGHSLAYYHQKADHLIRTIIRLLLMLSAVPYIAVAIILQKHRIAAVKTKIMPLAVLSLFCLISVFIRMPFFFQSVIDWDESTFIIMGQNILDGHLPYVKLWDNKPPLVFVSFAGFIWLFGDSIAGVRFAGAIWLAGAAYFTYAATGHLWGQKAGIFSGVLTIVFVCLNPSGLCTMAEIIALLPMMGALAVGVRYGLTSRSLFLVGFLISIAALIRLNLAYLAVVMGLFIVCNELYSKKRFSLAEPVCYVTGGLIPILLIGLPYVWTGHLDTLITSAVIAPLKYSLSQKSWLDSLIFHLKTGFGMNNALLWMGFLGGIGLFLRRKGHKEDFQKQGIKLFFAFFLGTALSIIKTGSAFPNHFIQMIALLALPAGLFYATLASHKYKKSIFLGFVILLVFSFYPRWDTYKGFARNLLIDNPLKIDIGYRLAAYLASANSEGEPIYLMYNHIAYWLTRTNPIRKIVTHPSNIGMPCLIEVLEGADASAETEMRKMIEMKPVFIVKRAHVAYLQNSEKAQEVLDNALFSHYDLATKIGNLLIFKVKRDDTYPKK